MLREVDLNKNLTKNEYKEILGVLHQMHLLKHECVSHSYYLQIPLLYE